MFDAKEQELANKNLTNSGYWLHYWEETIGPLERVWKENDSLNAKIGEITLILPREMENRLLPLMGKSIGILRTDIPQKEYLVRSISESKSQALGKIGVIDPAMPNAHGEKASA